MCWLISVDNWVPILACELQVILYCKDISVQFEISNKKLLFDYTKIITFDIFDLFINTENASSTRYDSLENMSSFIKKKLRACYATLALLLFKSSVLLKIMKAN